jgi:SET domain-containing protein
VHHMTRSNVAIALLFALMLGRGTFALFAEEPAVNLVPVLKINKEYDQRTVIKPSMIPNAGNGLFALTPIKKGEIVGELGGRLVTAENYPAGNHYVASIPECAWAETHPYKYLDSKDFGGNVSRTNFAPSRINGIETHFQNAAIRQLCDYPYFVFIALQDIEPGTEIWASYGPRYEYDTFMQEPAVRDFFCGLINVDCHTTYSYEH